jgi:hypothetical protein
VHVRGFGKLGLRSEEYIQTIVSVGYQFKPRIRRVTPLINGSDLLGHPQLAEPAETSNLTAPLPYFPGHSARQLQCLRGADLLSASWSDFQSPRDSVLEASTGFIISFG